MRFKLFLLTSFLLSANVQAERWSRQISDTDAAAPAAAASDKSDSFDWVPVTQPSAAPLNDRSGNERALKFNGNFPLPAAVEQQHKRQIPQTQHYQHIPQQASQFDFPYQFQRFGFQPPQSPAPQKSALQQQQPHTPTSQSFFKFEMPAFSHDGHRQEPSVQTGYQIQHSFGPHQAAFASPLFPQKQTFPPEFHPIQHQVQPGLIQQQRKPIQQNFIEEPRPKPAQEHVPSPSVSPSFTAQPAFQIQKPASFQSQSPFAAAQHLAPQNGAQNGEVQLLYVPYDTLYNQREQQPQPQQQQFQNNKYNLVQPQVNPYQINDFYTPETLINQNANLYTTSTTLRPAPPHPALTKTSVQTFLNPQGLFTTEAPKPKQKAHQPPLAMFFGKTSNRVSQQDVVSALSNANSIDVLDTPSQPTPSVFVGPAGMPTPNGYKKFDLPYLSNIEQNSIENNLKDIPFFVAPLSYRTPNGFNKILLPEPHVGSIVVNKQHDDFDVARGTTRRPSRPVKTSYITPIQEQFTQYQPTTPRVQPTTTHRLKVSSPKDFYPELIKEISSPNLNGQSIRGQYEQPATSTRGYKWPTVDDQNSVTLPPKDYYPQQEVTSPRIRGKPHHKKRPEQASRPYANFQPMPNNIANDGYYKVQPLRTSPPTTTTTTTTTTSTTPYGYFTQTYPTSPEVDIQSIKGQVYHDVSSTRPDEVNNRFAPRPTSQAETDEEYRMKTYFRQQEAFRKHPYVPSTTQGPVFENVQYTPVSVDFDREVHIPSTTPSYYESSTIRPTTTPKQRYTFYHPSPTTPAYEQEANTVPLNEDVVTYSRLPEVQTEKTTRLTTEKLPITTSLVRIPSNHRPTYGNEVKYSNDVKSQEGDVEYEPNPYQLPSELPPLTPNLPGLVNSLIEKERLNGLDKPTTEMLPETTTPTTLRPSRRPIQRVRKPMVSKVSSSVSYSTSDSTTKRTVQRVRRPYTPRNYTSSSTPSSPTAAPTRSTFVRNPNRIRYNPTPEERQSLRLKQQRKQSGSKGKNQDEDLEYQRDVLKQNYPVFKPASRRPVEQTTTEKPASEQANEIFTVTPNSVQEYPGMLEPMQIAQQLQEVAKNNYGPGYFPNEEDSTEPITRNEISPVYATTTTTEGPRETTRRSPFIRRGNRLRSTTTTEAPAAPTTVASEERYTIRPRKVIKIRARTRRPHPASTTTAEPEVENPSRDNSYQNRFNQDTYEEDPQPTEAPRRLRFRPKLSHEAQEAQESQWSPAYSVRANHFQPLNEEKNFENKVKFDNDQEIVTADPDSESNEKKGETFLFNVSAGFGPTAGPEIISNDDKVDQMRSIKKSEKSFEELLAEVMSDIGKETPDTPTDQTFFENMKPALNQTRRRGAWRKVRVRPTEAFETAESQNIATQLINSVHNPEESVTEAVISKEATTMAVIPEEYTQAPTAPEASTYLPPNHKPEHEEVYIAPTPTGSDEDTTMFQTVETAQSQDTITRRIDDVGVDEDVPADLDTQPSLFAEVKRQLTDLFAAESEDEFEEVMPNGVNPRKQEYTSIQRVRAPTESTEEEELATEANDEEVVTKAPTERTSFHRKLMDSVVYATSTSTKVTHETEICYRGRCIKSEKTP